MSWKKKLVAGTSLAVLSTVTIHLINKFIFLSATVDDLLNNPPGSFYEWKFGRIYYTKKGEGTPLLLIHDLSVYSSGYEWNKIAKDLSKNYTVYTIDLLGFGRSEKPNLTYTNYLYVQLISDFIKSEIGHRTDMIASGSSAALGIMACSNSPELFNQLLFINPECLLSCSQVPGKNAKLYKIILDLPIVGTLIYNIACSKQFITKEFLTNYYYNPYSVKTRVIEAYHESAHLGESPKSVYASLKCNYVKCNIAAALKKIDNSIYLLGGGAIDDIGECMEEYKEYNPAVEYAVVPNTKLLPHLEKPAEVFDMIQTYLS